MDAIKGQKLSDEDVSSRIFHDMTFCTSAAFLLKDEIADLSDIPRGTPEHKKADLEALVHQHGGEFTQAQLADLSAYVISPDNKSTSDSISIINHRTR